MSMELVTQILSWVLPPILGAIIGYVTNYIAIKMLFRPLTEKRLFGIRVPLTPGIIPKQRHVLAESIGNMVSKRLLTFSAFKEHLENPHFQQSLHSHLSKLTESILCKQLSFFKEEKVTLFLHFIESFIFKTLFNVFQSDKIIKGVRLIVRDIISALLNKNTYEILASIKFKEILASFILPFITRPEFKSWLYKEISKWTNAHLKKNTPIADILPVNLIDDMFKSFENFLPYLIKGLFTWLRTEDTKETLERQGRELIKNIFKKLNLFQQFFVSVGQYDKTLTEKMPEIVDDTLISLESAAKDPENQMNFLTSSKKTIRTWLKKGFFDLFYDEAIHIDDKLHSLIDTLFSILGSNQAKEFILNQVDNFIEKNKDIALKEFLESQVGIEEDTIIEFISEYITQLLAKKEIIEKISQILVNLVTSLFKNLEKQSIWELLGLDEKSKQGMDNFLFEKVNSIIEQKLPDLVSGLDVKTLVVNKINGLDIVDVEKLLLMVIAQHLRWINVFGALLGALIGCIQVFVNIFIR